MKYFSRFLQIGGVFFFAAVVIAVLLFSEGYQYDSKDQDLVKKGVIYFEEALDGYDAFLDGQPVDIGFTREIRTIPGVHDLELRRDGYEAWKKHLTVPEDMVIRFPRIKLLPASESVREQQLVSIVEPVGRLALQSVSELGLFAVNSAMHFGKLYTLNSRSAPFAIFEMPSKSDIIPSGNRIISLDTDGKVWSIADTETPPRYLFGIDATQKKLRKMVRAQDTSKYLMMQFETLRGERTIFILQSDGTVIFQDCCIESAFIENDLLYFTSGLNYSVYDLKEKKIVREYKIKRPLLWMNRIGDSFHFLFLTRERQLLFCDEDGENCRSIITLDAPFLAASQDNMSFLGEHRGNFVRIDFEK